MFPFPRSTRRAGASEQSSSLLKRKRRKRAALQKSELPLQGVEGKRCKARREFPPVRGRAAEGKARGAA